MNGPIAALLAAAMIVFAGIGGAAAQMQTFSSSEGRLEVQLPGRPQYIPTDVAVAGGGTIKLHQYAVEVGNSLAFITSYADYPVSIVAGARGDEVLRRVQTASVGQRKLVGDGVIDIDGNAGRFYVAEGADGLVLQARIYLVGNRLYQNIVVSDLRSRGAPEIRQFFDSFRLLK